jgi:FtsP/CotA-like multicopper oxidase with cupredoxin domain
MLSRRHFLAGSLAAAVCPRIAIAQSSLEEAILEFAPREAKLLGPDSPSTTVWSSGTSWPPAMLRAKQGQEFRVLIRNLLEREITLHWYGVRGPSDMMSVRVVPGADNALSCVFTPPDAGTFCFGPMEDVSLAREMGVYGLLVVEEAEQAVQLLDIPVILDDWKIAEDGAIDPGSFGLLEEAIGSGRLGNWFTMNGTFRPQIDVPANKVARLRVLNAANVRTMSLLFKGADPMLVSLDGQPVPPRSLSTVPLVLAPCQRCDLLLPEGADDVTLALNLFEDVVEIGYLRRTGTAGTMNLPDNFRLTPNPISVEAVGADPAEISLVIEGGEGGGMKSAKLNGEILDLRSLLEKGKAWSINGTAGMAEMPVFEVGLGQSVLLTVVNTTKFEQPLHIHGHVWKLIEVDGKALADEPWRDTAVVPAGKTARLMFIADNPGRWGLHSTTAERMDTGLITSFEVQN